MASFQDLLSTKAIQPQHPRTILFNLSGNYYQLRSASHIAPEAAGRQTFFICTRLPWAMQTGMRSLTAALLLLALLAPLACQASPQGRELKQDLSSITNLASGSGLGNIAGGSGFNIGSITSALSGLAGGSGGLTNLASNIGGGSGGLGNIVSAVSSVGGRKMLSN